MDAVHGPQRFLSGDIGDFIIRRDDGTTVLRATRQRFLNDNVLDGGLGTSVELFDGDVSDANLVQRTAQTWSILDGETGLPVNYAAFSKTAEVTYFLPDVGAVVR